jgi:hypothetical protein
MCSEIILTPSESTRYTASGLNREPSDQESPSSLGCVRGLCPATAKWTRQPASPSRAPNACSACSCPGSHGRSTFGLQWRLRLSSDATQEIAGNLLIAHHCASGHGAFLRPNPSLKPFRNGWRVGPLPCDPLDRLQNYFSDPGLVQGPGGGTVCGFLPCVQDFLGF